MYIGNTPFQGLVGGGNILDASIEGVDLSTSAIAARLGYTPVDPGAAVFSANPTISSGVANGIAYLNGSKVVTTGSALTFDGSTLWVAAGSLSTDSLNTAGFRFGAGTFKQQFSAGFDYQQFYTAANQSAPDASVAVGSGYYSLKIAGSEQLRLNSSNLLVGLQTALANGKFQVAGGIGLSGNTQIRQATNSDGNTLQVLATQFVAGSLNSISYGYTGGGLIASVAPGDSSLLLDIGRSTSTEGRFKVLNTTSANTAISLEKNGTYTIYADTGSGNLGVGTNSPAYKLDVNGSANFAASVYHRVGGAPIFAASGGYNYYYNNTGGTIWRNSADSLEYMRLDSSGNFFVGTTTGSSRINVGASSGAAASFYAPSGTTQQNIVQFLNSTNNGYTAIVGAGTSSVVSSWNNGAQIIEFVPYSTGDSIISAYSGNLLFQVNGRTERMRLSSGGRLSLSYPGGSDSDPAFIVNCGTANNTFNWAASFLNVNLTAGKNISVFVGRATNSGNAGYIGFNYQGDNVAANALTFGLHSNDNILNIRNDGAVIIGAQAPHAGTPKFGIVTTLNQQYATQLAWNYNNSEANWAGANALFIKNTNGADGSTVQASIGFAVTNTGGDHHRASIHGYGINGSSYGGLKFYTRGPNETVPRITLDHKGVVAQSNVNTWYGGYTKLYRFSFSASGSSSMVTYSIGQIVNYDNTYGTATVKVRCPLVYATAGSNVGYWEGQATIRRANNGTAWATTYSTIHTNDGANAVSDPVIYWSGDTCYLDAPVYVGFNAEVEVIVWNGEFSANNY